MLILFEPDSCLSPLFTINGTGSSFHGLRITSRMYFFASHVHFFCVALDAICISSDIIRFSSDVFSVRLDAFFISPDAISIRCAAFYAHLIKNKFTREDNYIIRNMDCIVGVMIRPEKFKESFDCAVFYVHSDIFYFHLDAICIRYAVIYVSNEANYIANAVISLAKSKKTLLVQFLTSL